MNEQQQRCQETRELLSQGARLIDVRTTEEFAAGALPGAINLPLQVMPGVTDLLDKTSAVVVYCGTGQRSGQAKRLLEQAGVQRVHNLGGLNDLHQC